MEVTLQLRCGLVSQFSASASFTMSVYNDIVFIRLGLCFFLARLHYLWK